MSRSNARQRHWSKPSLAPDLSDGERTFTVTHPYHPLVGREYSLVTYRHTWGEDRVYFHDDEGNLLALPASWTSFAPKDPFREVAAGRCWFRFIDLMELVALVHQLGASDDSLAEEATD